MKSKSSRRFGRILQNCWPQAHAYKTVLRLSYAIYLACFGFILIYLCSIAWFCSLYAVSSSSPWMSKKVRIFIPRKRFFRLSIRLTLIILRLLRGPCSSPQSCSCRSVLDNDDDDDVIVVVMSIFSCYSCFCRGYHCHSC